MFLFLLVIYFRCKIALFHVNMHSMSNRCEITAIPNVPDYALGEKLGAGSFGIDFY